MKTRARKEGRKKKITREGLRTGQFTMEGKAALETQKTKQRRKAKETNI